MKTSQFGPLKKDDVVAFYCCQSGWHVVWIIAIAIVGGVYTGNFDVLPEIAFLDLVKSSQAKYIVASDIAVENAERIGEQLKEQVKCVFKLLSKESDEVNDEKSLVSLCRQREEYKTIHTSDYKVEQLDFLLELASKINPLEDFFVITFSSGTTGKPKKVGRTHFSYQAIMNLRHETFGLGESEIVFAASAHFGHVGSMSTLIYSLVVRGSIAITTYYPDLLLDAISKYKVTNTFVVPATIIAIIAFVNDPKNENFVKSRDFSSLKDIMIAGEFLPLHVSEEFVRLFPSVTKYRQLFGSTEMSFVTCVPKDCANLDNALFSGIPMPGVSFKISPVDEEAYESHNGKICSIVTPGLPFNQIGEVMMKGSQVSRYTDNQEANDTSFDADGYFKTGDGGFYDERGFLKITDRFKSIFKVDGAQVSPSELEDILLTHPLVKSVIVTNKPDELHGSVAMAFVIAAEPLSGVVHDSQGNKVDQVGNISTVSLEEELKNYVADRVEDIMQITGGVIFFTDFPMTILGKIDRKFLKVNFAV